MVVRESTAMTLSYFSYLLPLLRWHQISFQAFLQYHTIKYLSLSVFTLKRNIFSFYTNIAPTQRN